MLRAILISTAAHPNNLDDSSNKFSQSQERSDAAERQPTGRLDSPENASTQARIPPDRSGRGRCCTTSGCRWHARHLSFDPHKLHTHTLSRLPRTILSVARTFGSLGSLLPLSLGRKHARLRFSDNSNHHGQQQKQQKQSRNGTGRSLPPGAAFGQKQLLLVCALVLCANSAIFYGLSGYNAAQQKQQIQHEAVTPKDHHEDEDGIGIIEELYRVANPERLQKIAREHREAYARAEPFPHAVIDGIFPERFLEAVSKEMPEGEGGNCYNPRSCFKSKRELWKSGVDDEKSMGFYTRVFFAFLKSSTWVKFLEELSGIRNIVPDPHYSGSGLHLTGSGGKLDVQADFNKLRQYGLDRRVNTFVYMNHDWPESYGGHLELWGRDMGSCYQKILPALGRYVVFSSTDFSYHGHPQEMPCPKNRYRRSVALYYYTNGRPAEECLRNNCNGKHSTLFQKPVNCTVCEEATCKRYDDATPYWVDATATQ